MFTVKKTQRLCSPTLTNELIALLNTLEAFFTNSHEAPAEALLVGHKIFQALAYVLRDSGYGFSANHAARAVLVTWSALTHISDCNHMQLGLHTSRLDITLTYNLTNFASGIFRHGSRWTNTGKTAFHVNALGV